MGVVKLGAAFCRTVNSILSLSKWIFWEDLSWVYYLGPQVLEEELVLVP